MQDCTGGGEGNIAALDSNNLVVAAPMHSGLAAVCFVPS
jgi:hypothetical protein